MNEIPSTYKPIFLVRMDDGCQIAVRSLRTGREGLPVVAIHALAMDGSMWQDTASCLSADVRMFALDCRGHGQSDKPRGPYSTERFADDVIQVLDHLGYERAVIAGCSMGGTIALAVAGRYPERVKGLAVFDTTSWYGAEASAKWEQRARKALDEGMAALIDFQLERWFSPEFLATHPEVAQRALDLFLMNDVEPYAETCRMLGRADERMRIEVYKGPVVLALGENDFATPLAMAEEIRKRMTQTDLSVIPGVRHFTPFEVPKEVALRIDQVIDAVSGESEG